MKKVWPLILLLTCGLVFTGCSTTKEEEPNLEDETVRVLACTQEVGNYLKTEDFSTSWQPEEEWGASFILNGTATRTKDGEQLENAVQCVIDMVDKSVTVHM